MSTLRACCGVERTDFSQFVLWENVVVLKELILNSLYFEKVVVVLKELIFHSFYFGMDVLVLIELIFHKFYFGRMWWS